MGALKGDLSKLRTIRDNLRALPKTLAADVAVKAAPVLTTEAQVSFDSGQSVYGVARPLGVDGNALTLRGETGDTERAVRFYALGSQVLTPEFPKYFRFLIGKYAVMPGGNAAIPVSWKAILDRLTHETKAKL